MFRLLVLTLFLAGTIGLPVEQTEDHGLDFVLRNITALWEEIHDVKQEINQHLHDGHDEEGHDQIVKEVETLHHEHHVHHLHHPHPGHNEHHDAALLKHLEEAHGHLDTHSDGQPVHGHLHGHGHSHDHHHVKDHDDDDDHDEDHSEEDHDDHDDDGHDHRYESDHGDHTHGHAHHEDEDAHDAHGLHSHEDEHEYGHEHEHSHVSDSHDHDDHSEASERRPGLALIPGRPRPGGIHDSDPWMHASCVLKPNVDAPDSNVKGSIIISQRVDEKGPVYFDLHVTGMDVATTGTTHGFHVHERRVTDGKCGSTGGHFNPDEVVHGAPEDDVRHVGDLGNIEVGDDGELHGYIIADEKVAFKGTNSIIGRSIVVHAGEDVSEGADESSMLACCNVYMGAVPL